MGKPPFVGKVRLGWLLLLVVRLLRLLWAHPALHLFRGNAHSLLVD